jgi:hypothetical protein
VSLTLQYPTRCAECGMRMAVGDEYLSSTTSSGQWVITHPECPERKPRAQNLEPSFDVENLLEIRKCSECGEIWTFRGRLEPTCPGFRIVRDGRAAEQVRCGGAWLRGDPEEIGWAA